MQFKEAIKTVFGQLEELLARLSEGQYQQPSKILFNATIGQHVRHIIELYICLFNGYETGIVNYEKRKREIRIETDKEFALELMQMIAGNLDKCNKDLLLEGCYDDSLAFSVTTNYYREIIYNLEHTVHHMALIRVGLCDVSAVVVPEGFGVASSTLKYRNQCAQ